jgi:hypothetical protein
MGNADLGCHSVLEGLLGFERNRPFCSIIIPALIPTYELVIKGVKET